MVYTRRILTSKIRHIPLLAVTLITATLAIEPRTAEDGPKGQESPQGPVFISEPPSHLVFPNTAGAWLPCSAYGSPAPALDWQRAAKDTGTQAIPLDDVPGLLTVLPNNTLYFHPFSEDSYRPEVHAASFRCSASNSAGKIVSRLVKVNAVLLKQYKTYNLRANDVYVTRGGTAVLKCSIDPYYVREYVRVTTWTQGGKELPSNDKFSVLSGGELHIRAMTDEDSYVMYRCVAKNLLTGEVRESDPASIYTIEPVTSPPSIENSESSLSVRQGEPVELPCVARGFPLPAYSWTKDGVPLSSDQDRARQRGGNLLIQNVGPRDSGVYVCMASNHIGQKTAETSLVVTAPLSAYVEPAHQTVDVGRSASFNCTVYGHPVSTIQWYKDGRPLVGDSRITMVTAQSLRIVSVQRQDKGMYQCLVKNEAENAQGSAQLALGSAVPYIYQKFDDQYLKPGTRVSLMCRAAGNPPPMFRWTLDDGPIPLDDRFSVSQITSPEGEIVSYVNITNLRVQDGGRYKCSAVNMAGSGSHVGILHVYGLPYVRPMSNVTSVAGEILAIRCHVSGYPIVSITWKKDGASLPTNHRQQVSRDGTLTIRDVDRSYDEGEYVCDARNAAGQGMARTVALHVLEPPRIDSFLFPAKKEGDRVSVSCVVSSGDLPIDISWKKDGKDIPHDLGIVLQKTGTYSSLMSIGHAYPRHNGNYTCIAKNRAASKNYTAELKVHVPSQWVIEPQDTFVVLGQSVTIDCQTSGDPTPKVTWKKAKGDHSSNYETLNSSSVSSGASHVRLLSNGSLKLVKAGLDNHGYYLCHSSNGIGAGLSKVVFLTVHVPARFVQRERNYTVHEGGNITMECVADGDKPLSMSWSFNGGDLNFQYNGRLQPSHFNVENGRGSRLTIKPAHRDDTGFYVCNAKNMFGSDAVTSRLLVLEPPEAPEDVETHSGTSRSVQLSWFQSFDGNSPITGYIIQVKNTSAPWDEPIREVHAGVTDISSALVDDLHPDSSYDFRVIAQNAIGRSSPSLPVSFVAGEEAPSGIPRNVQVVPLGSKSLSISWEPPAEDQQNGEIQGYYLGYKRYNSTAPYMYITKSVDEQFVAAAVIENLDKFTRYSIHVQAYNKMGAGPRTEDIDVLTLEDVPSQAPQDVQATPVGSQGLMVVWSPPPLYTLHGILQGYKILYKPVRDDEDETDALAVQTSKLTIAMYGLLKFTNYSIQVLAYTRRGEGVRSQPIYIRTQPDLPERPADIKGLAAGPDSILVTWRPPLHTNGVLLRYILHQESQSDKVLIELPANQLSHLVTNLSVNHEYRFQVQAATVVGVGDLTHQLSVTTVEEVAASIASFSMVLYAHWQNDVILPCLAVGTPMPAIKWKRRGEFLVEDERVHFFDNGSLWISDLQGVDAANYTCRAENTLGADEIKITLIVQAPPKHPVLVVAATTKSTIQVKWRSGSNGGSKLQGFSLYYKRDHSPWEKRTQGPQNRSYVASNLRCGTKYTFYMRAFNRVGDGVPSENVVAKTNGSTPIMPAQSLILEHINSTFVVLALHTWLSGGCPITFYDIEYQYWGDTTWETVESHIDPTTLSYKVDVRPETWYIMRVTAHNDAGSTECILKFPTKTYEGSTIKPQRIVNKYDVKFYEKIYIMVPLCAIFVFLIVLMVGTGLYCKRRHEELKYKAQNASNLRRDLTAETSLMSDSDKMGDKRERETSDYTVEPTRQLNVNLLAADNLRNKQTGLEETSPWLLRGSANESGSSGSGSSNTDSEGNINPYATFPHARDGYRPNNADCRDNGMNDPRELPPPPPELLEGGDQYQNSPGQNAGARRYGSADCLRQPTYRQAPDLQGDSTYPRLMTKTPPAPAGQRLSMASNVSSNHEELSRALGSLPSKQPAPPERDSSLSRASRPGTGSDVAEPELRSFTQSPALPNDQRRATCEMPLYEAGRSRPSHLPIGTPYPQAYHQEQPSSHKSLARQVIPQSRRSPPLPPKFHGQVVSPTSPSFTRPHQRGHGRVPPKPPPRRSPLSSQSSSPPSRTSPSGGNMAASTQVSDEQSPLVGEMVSPVRESSFMEDEETRVGLLSSSNGSRDCEAEGNVSLV